MIKLEQQHWRLISRRFWGTLFTLIIAIAVCIQLGRQAFPLLKDYQDEIAGYFGSRLGMQIEVESIDASWAGLRPKLTLKHVSVNSESGEPVFNIGEATAELSIVNSIVDRRLSWRQLVFDGLDTALVQNKQGGWAIPGMPEFSNPPQDEYQNEQERRLVFDDPYDVFLLGRRISISDAKFTLRYFSGDESQLIIPKISIENDFDFHRILASLDVDEGEEAFSLVVEGHGDPREKNFVANGFLELKNFPTQNVIDALALQSLKVDGEAHKTNVKIWFRGNADKGTTLRGEFSANGDVTLDGSDIRLPKEVKATIVGKAHRDDGWQVTLKDFQSVWKNLSSPSVDIAFSGSFRRLHGVRIKELDIKPWIDTLLHVGLDNELAEKSLKKVNPRGRIRNLDVAFTTKEEGYFRATGFVENGTSEAIMGAPSVGNANGYFSVSMRDGSFDISVDDGLTLGLPKVYHEPLYFAQADGQIRWQIDFDNKMTYISSGLLTVTNPEEQGKGYLNLSLPFSKKYGEQQMTLSIGIQNTLAKNHKKYVPKTIPKHLYNWLGTSIREGRVANAKFLYHGSLEKSPKVSPTIQLYGEVYDGNLKFYPEWPELEGVSGSLTLENDTLDVRIDKASLLGNSVFDAEITLVDDKTVQGRALSIKGSLASDVNSAMTLLKNSPIKSHIGSTFDEWIVSGGVGAKVELLIPLNSESTGLSHAIDVTFSKAQIQMPDLNLEINDIAGELHYQTHKGMFSDRLSGNVWGRPFVASISSPENSNGGTDTSIDFSGAVSVDDMYAWTLRPELKFTEGVSHVVGNLFIPGESSDRPFEVNVTSTLDGVAINLPKPFSKLDSDKADFKTRIRFYDAGEEYQFTLDDQLKMTLLSEASGTTSALIEINEFKYQDDRYQPLKSSGRFDISGKLEYFDLEVWNEAKDQYFGFADPSGELAEEENPIPAKFSLAIDKFLLGTLEIDNLKVNGERQSPFWAMNINSELMTGKVLVPEDDRPITLDLEYLRFAEEETEDQLSENGTKQSVLKDIDLGRAVALDFTTKELSLGETNYGSWDFKLRPIKGGIVIHDIFAETKGMRLGEDGDGAEFVWLKDEARQSSQFTGVITAQNLADVFEAWEQEKLMESQSALINIDAQWPGAPDEVTLKNVKGLIGLDVRKGSFNRGAGSDENGLLRLLALFNFDTILRRLRLDFSDLAAQGFSYDRVYGNLDFRDGSIYLTEPLIVESSSSVVQLAGIVDVANERLDSEMVVTLPLASSAAFATAVVVNLPAALGLYVMSKLFKKQVDKASTINVEVTGKWEDPKIKVRKIFDIDAANRRGKELKEKSRQEQLDTTSIP